MHFDFNLDRDDGNISPQLPSFVDVVFILLIFFIVLSVVGFGVVESGNHSEGIFEREQDLSEFPAVQKALHKTLNEFVTLSLDVDEQEITHYYAFSSEAFQSVVIQDLDEYETIRAKIESNQIVFSGGVNETQFKTLKSAWGPFIDVEAMSRSWLVQNARTPNLIIQADENFSYHQILEVMRLFRQFKSVYFEVIENETNG
jgi:biopolymer transport protein ExbD